MEKISDDELIKLWNMVFNLSLHMLHNEMDAQEATQSIFEKVMQKMPDFKQQSKLSTWVYRISYNFLIDELRYRKNKGISFESFESEVNNFKPYENELGLSDKEEQIYVEEIKVGCTLALLQCLDKKNRFIFILGTIFDFPQKDAAIICQMEYNNYRRRLHRTTEKVRNFMKKNCGLLNPEAECKCNKRILIATERGRINPEKLLYKTESREIKSYIKELNEIDEISKVYQNNPFSEQSENNLPAILNQFRVLQER